jgi:hypothetical protein
VRFEISLDEARLDAVAREFGRSEKTGGPSANNEDFVFGHRLLTPGLVDECRCDDHLI